MAAMPGRAAMAPVVAMAAMSGRGVMASMAAMAAVHTVELGLF